MKDHAFAARCRSLRLVLLDVDGVLTDGRLLFLPDGQEVKAFHVRDGLGIVLAHRAGLPTGLLSARESPLATRRAAELGMAVIRMGAIDKRAALQDIARERGLRPDEIAFMGDDLVDLPALGEVGLSAAPADAPLEVRSQVFMVTDTRGGEGCVREFLEAILKARGDWDGLLAGLGIAP
jgi:3-deoxy-D-manno-octulosonate 8-phosphate phosphatase (KDO 8-P phosphatase)